MIKLNVFITTSSCFSEDNSPKLIKVLGFFFLQAFNTSEVPRNFFGRFVLVLLLIVGVLYNALFSSGILGKLMSPRFEKLMIIYIIYYFNEIVAMIMRYAQFETCPT